MKAIASLGLGCLIALVGGCGAPNLSVEITGPTSYSAPSSGGGPCTTNTPGAGDIPRGTMDIATSGAGAVEPFAITNNMASDTVDTSTGQVSGAAFQGQKVVATYLGTDDATTSALASVTAQAPVTVTAPPDGGQWVGPVTLIPASVAQKIGQILGVTATTEKTVIVRFHIEGVRVDGMAVSTSTYQFPVDVCSGCLANPACPTGSTASFCYAGQKPYFCSK